MILPTLIVAVDPDSKSSALAWALWSAAEDAYVFGEALGGGTRAVPWQSVTGAMTWLDQARRMHGLAHKRITVAVETQAPNGPASADVESLRRVRYHWEAACEVEGSVSVSVGASTWQYHFVGQPKGRGAVKRAYMLRARQLTEQATNEDRCAAIGMLWWYCTIECGKRLAFNVGPD